MSIKKALCFTLILLVCIMPAYAIYFNAELTAVRDKISSDKAALFTITITNKEESIQKFRIRTIDYPRWSIYTDPLINPIILIVPPLSNESRDILIKPNEKYVGNSGSYQVNLEVISESSAEKMVLHPRIGLIPGDSPSGYVPTVIISTDFPDEIEPSEEIIFKINLANQNNLDIKGATLYVSSSFIDEKIPMDISPKEKKVIEIKKKIDPKTKPKEDRFTISFDYKGRNVDNFVKVYNIAKYSRISDERNIKASLLTKSETIIFTNKGNVPFKGELRIATNWLKRLFGSIHPESNVINEQGKQYHVIYTELNPFESTTVRVTENYLALIIILAALVVFGIYSFIMRSPVMMRKQVIETDTENGELSKLKVMLNIRNRSNDALKDISVIDKIPKLLDIERQAMLGSLSPDKVRKNLRLETLIMWKVDELMPGEERVITYQLNSNLKIIGGFTLHPAMSKFMLKDRQVKTHSNKVFVRV